MSKKGIQYLIFLLALLLAVLIFSMGFKLKEGIDCSKTYRDNGCGCKKNSECDSQYCVRKCKTKPIRLSEVGEECSENKNCTTYNCSNYKCIDKKNTGEKCSAGGQCKSGKCEISGNLFYCK